MTRSALLALCVVTGFRAHAAELPPLPSDLPVTAPQPQTTPIIRRPRVAVPRPVSVPSKGLVRPYQPATVSDDILSWDAISKEYTAQPGDLAANFSFSVTNVSKSNVVVNWVRPSCGCTVAKLPPTPWTLASGETGNIELTVDLRNKFGVLSKYVSVDTSHGQKLLNLKITIPNQGLASGGGMDARTRNMQVAMADRQAVFRGDCASCHATPTVGKKGERLYAAACAICHDAPHRATMVPDLRTLKNPTGKEYWEMWVTNGKPGTLMPAFARAQGGPLEADQIASLAEFLNEKFPNHPATTAANVAPTTAVRN